MHASLYPIPDTRSRTRTRFELSASKDTDDIDDNPNSQGVSMLEVIIRDDSPKEAQEMLLDSFMPVQGKGFIFHLIERKWEESRQWFNVSAVLLLSYTVSLTLLTVRVPSFGDVTETSPHLREFSDTGGRLRVSDARWLIYLILLFSFLLVMEEVRFVYLWCPGAPVEPRTCFLASPLGAACQLLITTWQVQEQQGAIHGALKSARGSAAARPTGGARCQFVAEAEVPSPARHDACHRVRGLRFAVVCEC